MNQPPDVETFNQTVWKIVQQVPSGQVTTYGQIAAMIPCPAGVADRDYRKLAPRWVGNAMNAISGEHEEAIPWQRVINSKGGISMSLEGKVGRLQLTRLQDEGIEFNDDVQVDFRKVGWAGPDEDWLAAHGLLPAKPLAKKDEPDKPQQLSLF